MLLAIDIGNTNTHIGVFEDDALVGDFRLASTHVRTADEVAVVLSQFLMLAPNNGSVTDAITCSVVPNLTPIYEQALKKYWEVVPEVLTWKTPTGLLLQYDDPSAIGPDRIADAVAAYHIYGGPVIIVDFGTATTVDAVSGDGRYLGGAIAPGPESSGTELAKRAAMLFQVRLEPPGKALCTNTADSIRAGLVYGTAGQVSRLLAMAREEMGDPADLTTVATGGLAELFCRIITQIDTVNPTLTLEGLKIIYERVHSKKRSRSGTVRSKTKN